MKKKTAKTKKKASPKGRSRKNTEDAERVQITGSKFERIQSLLARVNSEKLLLRAAEELSSSYLLRRPTGIPSIDLKFKGGFAAGSANIIVGPDGVGKDYLTWMTAAAVQKIYGDDFALVAFMTEFRPDKQYMRDMCGFKVAMSDEELDEKDIIRVGNDLPMLTLEERERYKEQVGTVQFIYGVTADMGLDVLFECIATNAYQLAVVNSIGSFQTEAKEDVDSFSEHPQQRNEASLLTRFFPKLSMYLNAGDPVDPRLPNETTILVINQVRGKDAGRSRPGYVPQEKDKYRPAVQAWSMKHNIAMELILHKSKDLYDEKTETIYGREISWKLLKGKLGVHDGVNGKYEYLYDEGANIYDDLLNIAVDLKIVEMSGAWFNYGEVKAQGRPKMITKLTDGDLFEEIKTKCFRAAEIEYRYR